MEVGAVLGPVAATTGPVVVDLGAAIRVLVGLVVLVGGAEVLVRGAAGIAERFGTPPLVIGLTVVAFGTSAPELAVTIGASASGAGAVALGNVVGSNLFNLLVVLGLTALVAGLHVDRALIRFEAPLLVVLTGAVLLFARDGLQRGEGVVLLLGAVLFTAFLLLRARRTTAAAVTADTAGAMPRAAGAAPPAPEEPDPLAAPAGARSLPLDLGLVVLGFGLLVGGARLLVDGATTIAGGLGVPEVVIGLTLVAAGTSLPELATSVVAAVRGQRDIAVGNALGSNVLNLLVVLGAGVVAAPGGLAVDPTVVTQDLPVLLLAQVVAIPMLFTRARIGRIEALVLLGGYLTYVLLVLLPRMT